VTNGLISLIEQNRVSPLGELAEEVLGWVCRCPLAEFFTMDLSATPQAFSAPTISWSWAIGSLAAAGSGAAPRAAADGAARAICGRRGHRRGNARAPRRGGGVVIRGRNRAQVGGAARVLEAGEAYYSPASFRIASATSGARL